MIGWSVAVFDNDSRRFEDYQRQCKHYCSQQFKKMEDLYPFCTAQTDRRAEAKLDGNVWRFHWHVWLKSAVFGKHCYYRWDLVLPIRSRDQATIDGMVFIVFPAFQKSWLIKSKIKTMLIAFFDSNGSIHHEFLPEGETDNVEFYKGVLKWLLQCTR